MGDSAERAVSRWRESVRSACLSLFVVLAVLPPAPPLAWGHPRPAPTPSAAPDAGPQAATPVIARVEIRATPESAAPAPLPAVLLVAAGLGLVGAGLGPKRTATLSLAVLLGIFAFETGIHSVHHLDNADQAGKCPVAAAFYHVHGASCEPPDVHAPALISGERLVATSDADFPSRFFGPDRGRAPPAFS